MSNKNCGPDVVKYFVVEPSGGGGSVTGATGDFYVCSGTTFVETISGCDDSVDLNGNTFYNSGEVFFNGIISACTGIHTSNIFGCSPITVHDEIIFLSGETLANIERDDTLTQILARDSVTGKVKYRDVISIITGATSQDTFVTGFTFNTSTYDLTIKQNEGQPDLVTNLASLATDVYVVSGVYNPNTGIVTYTNTSGGTFEVSGFTTGMTDSYTTDAYLSGTELRFDNNIQGINFYNVDLLPLLSGKTNVTTFNTYTANTQTILDGKIDSANNVGGANELFKDKSGTTLNFRTISGGSNTTVSTVGDLVRIDVSLPPSMNTYVTGGTYNPTTDIITLSRNDAVTIDITGVTDNFVVAGSYSDSTDTIFLLRQDGSFVNITGVTDTFTTGATYDNGTALATFNRNDGNSYTLDLSTIDVNDTFVTGFTYNDSNRFTISRNDGVNLSASINTMTGLTVNGSVSATTYFGDGSNLTGISTDDNYVTGGTLNSGTLTLERQNGIVIITGFTTDLDTYVTGGTVSVSATDSDNSGTIGLFYKNSDGIPRTLPFEDTFTTGATYDNGTALVTFTKNDGTNYILDLSSIDVNDTFVTGTTFVSNQATVTRNDGTDVLLLTGGTNVSLSNPSTNQIKIDVTIPADNNTFVTGFTYNNANTLTIERNDGVNLSTSINTMTGLTINGTLIVDTLSATTYTGLTLNDLDDVTSNIPTTPDNTYQGRLLYFDVTDNQWITGEEYVSAGNVTIWAKKGSAGTIDKGCPVYIVGFDNDIHEVELANASTGTTMPVIGFTGEDFDNAGVYPLITFGKLTGIDTTSTVSIINPNGETWAVNDVLFMNTTDGGLTKFRPTGSDTRIQRIAKVLNVGTTNGQIFIFNTARTAGLPNLTTGYLWVGNGDDLPQEVIKTDVGITTTGFTYNDANTFTISNNDGTSFNSSINIMTGFTVNNGVGDGFVTINSTSGQELEINQRGVNFNYSTPNIQVGTTGANMMIGNTGGIGSYPSGSYPGLNLNTTTGDIFLFNGGYGGTGAVMDFQGGNIRDIHDIQSSGNWPLKLYGGPGPNDANDGIQMYTADNLNVYTKKFEIKADTGTPNAYFTNINNFGVNTITPQTTLDVNGTTRLLGLTANTLNLVNTPTLNNSATDILVRNSGTGEVEYRPVSGITPDTNTFVISGTYVDSTDTLALLRNDGNFVNVTGITDTFVTGTTFSSNQATVTRNDGTEVLLLTGDTNVTLSNPSTNQIKIGLDLGIKSGTVRGTEFSGNPKTYKVIFTNAYSNDEYSINITGEDSRNYTYQNKTSSSFVINTNSNTSFTNQVDWVTIKYGEQ